MAYMRAGRGVSKPRAGAQIDWSHPLARGLQFSFEFHEGFGGTTHDRVRQRRGVLNSSPVWHPLGLSFSSSSYIEEATLPDALFLGAISLQWRGIIRTGSAFRHFIGKHAGNGSSNAPFDFGANNGAVPAPTLNRANASGVTGWLSSGTFPLLQLKTCTVTTPSGEISAAPSIYIDGVKQSVSQAGGTTGNATGTGAALRIGRRADGGTQMDGVCEFARGWSRALTADEVRWLAAEPYAFFVAPNPTRYHFVSSGVTSTSALVASAHTLSASGDVGQGGSAALTAAAHTLVASGAVGLSGSSAVTAAAHTLAATGSIGLSGTSAITAPAHTLASTGVVAVAITSTSDLTAAAHTLSSTGTVAVDITATSALTAAPHTMTATGVVTAANTGHVGLMLLGVG